MQSITEKQIDAAFRKAARRGLEVRRQRRMPLMADIMGIGALILSLGLALLFLKIAMYG